jgi:hypothetical protein
MAVTDNHVLVYTKASRALHQILVEIKGRQAICARAMCHEKPIQGYFPCKNWCVCVCVCVCVFILPKLLHDDGMQKRSMCAQCQVWRVWNYVATTRRFDNYETM